MPLVFAISTIASKSTTFISGLLGLSSQIIRVFSWMALLAASASVRSTKLNSSPALRSRTLWKSRRVPP